MREDRQTSDPRDVWREAARGVPNPARHAPSMHARLTGLAALALLALAVGGSGCRSGAERGAKTDGTAEEQTVSAHATTTTTPTEPGETAAAYFAGGCFWGVEHYFERAPGVKAAVSGYMGGDVADPSYEEVCTGRTGHAETVKVVYDPTKTSFEALAKLFFEIHDPTQVNRQGPDIGAQYRSAVFVSDDAERKAAEHLIAVLRERGYGVATTIEPAGPFYEAEGYHQDYYERKGSTPYCHARVRRFGD